MGHTLIVEDDKDAAQMLAALVAREGHSVSSAGSLASARQLLAMHQPDLLLLDVHLPDGSGFELFENAELLSDTEVVLITGQASMETSIKALRLGAADYLVKPVNPAHIKGLLSRLIRPSQLRAELAEIMQLWRQTGNFGQLIGETSGMQAVFQQIARVAGTAVTVFLHGESGTGKELVARAVHDLSRRRDQPFLAINCGALSPHLIESEIFGHERGSFTGAERQHQGFFERAHGGTLFLDEVTEMPLELQVKLLRVLESGTFMRVGSTDLQQTDVRIIAATNRDVASGVTRGIMREDLLYRLNVFPISLPPLRERRSDIPLLAKKFLQVLERQEKSPKHHFTSKALDRLMAYDWPGNVRELHNVVQRAWVMAGDSAITEEWLPGANPESPPPLESPGFTTSARQLPGSFDNGQRAQQVVIEVGSSLADIEREVILATFEHCGRHKERTAAVLGISMKTLYNRLKEYRQ